MTGKNLMSGEKTEFQEMIGRMCANREWLDQHIEELTAKYNIGDWVAVSDRRVIAQGSNSEEVKTALGENYPEETLIICVPEKEIAQPI